MIDHLGRVRAVRILLEESDGAFGDVTYVTVVPVEERHIPEQREYDVIEAVGNAAAHMISSVVRDAARRRV